MNRPTRSPMNQLNPALKALLLIIFFAIWFPLYIAMCFLRVKKP